jgi:hypothetical protein
MPPDNEEQFAEPILALIDSSILISLGPLVQMLGRHFW